MASSQSSTFEQSMQALTKPYIDMHTYHIAQEIDLAVSLRDILSYATRLDGRRYERMLTRNELPSADEQKNHDDTSKSLSMIRQELKTLGASLRIMAWRRGAGRRAHIVQGGVIDKVQDTGAGEITESMELLQALNKLAILHLRLRAELRKGPVAPKEAPATTNDRLSDFTKELQFMIMKSVVGDHTVHFSRNSKSHFYCKKSGPDGDKNHHECLIATRTDDLHDFDPVRSLLSTSRKIRALTQQILSENMVLWFHDLYSLCRFLGRPDPSILDRSLIRVLQFPLEFFNYENQERTMLRVGTATVIDHFSAGLGDTHSHLINFYDFDDAAFPNVGVINLIGKFQYGDYSGLDLKLARMLEAMSKVAHAFRSRTIEFNVEIEGIDADVLRRAHPFTYAPRFSSSEYIRAGGDRILCNYIKRLLTGKVQFVLDPGEQVPQNYV